MAETGRKGNVGQKDAREKHESHHPDQDNIYHHPAFGSQFFFNHQLQLLRS